MLDADAPVLAAIRKLAAQPGFDPVLGFYVERLWAAQASEPAQTAVSAAATPRAFGPAPARPATRPAVLEALSEREREVMALLAQALPNKKIARTLGLSPETIKWHLKNIYGKLGVATRDEAVARVRDLRDLRDTQ